MFNSYHSGVGFCCNSNTYEARARIAYFCINTSYAHRPSALLLLYFSHTLYVRTKINDTLYRNKRNIKTKIYTYKK